MDICYYQAVLTTATSVLEAVAGSHAEEGEEEEAAVVVEDGATATKVSDVAEVGTVGAGVGTRAGAVAETIAVRAAAAATIATDPTRTTAARTRVVGTRYVISAT